jgi:membrane-associated phospholipid phosphatase
MLCIGGFFLFMPKEIFKITLPKFYRNFLSSFNYLLMMVAVVILHLIEINLFDPYLTNLLNSDYTNIMQIIENGVVYWFSQHRTPVVVTFFVFIYIGVYPFTLWFSPLYFLLTNNKKAMKSLASGLIMIYFIALPFYLFFPITNVYTFYGLTSALETVIPGIEQFFYSTTTYNNCFPSLHVAMTLLIAKSISITKNKKFTYFAYFCSISVIISVLYLAIHWITDVIGGIILALSIFYLQKRFIKEI